MDELSADIDSDGERTFMQPHTEESTSGEAKVAVGEINHALGCFIMHTHETLIALNAVGFIGSWQIDFTMNRMRGTGRVGPFFGLSRAKVRSGVDLDLLDRAYLAKDLEAIKKNRRTMAQTGGRHDLRYSLRDPETEALVPVHSFIHVSVDRDGALREAQGVLFQAADRAGGSLGSDPTSEDALRSLTEASTALTALGYRHLQPVLQVVFKEVARDAIRRHLSPAPADILRDPSWS